MRGNPDKIKGQGFHTNPERINRKGRPRKIPELDRLLADLFGEETDENGKLIRESAAKEILKALQRKAKKGDVRAAEVILNRMYGKPKEFIDQNNTGDITVRVVRE